LQFFNGNPRLFGSAQLQEPGLAVSVAAQLSRHTLTVLPGQRLPEEAFHHSVFS